jgi:hypothetical protein
MLSAEAPTTAAAVCRHGPHEEEEVIYERLPSDIAQRYVLLLDPLVGTGRTACRAVQVSCRSCNEAAKVGALVVLLPWAGFVLALLLSLAQVASNLHMDTAVACLQQPLLVGVEAQQQHHHHESVSKQHLTLVTEVLSDGFDYCFDFPGAAGAWCVQPVDVLLQAAAARAVGKPKHTTSELLPDLTLLCFYCL